MAKEKWMQGECSAIDNNMACNSTAAAFKTIKDLTKSKTTRTTVIEVKDGDLLTDRATISNRWKEYCEELYNYQLTSDKGLLARLRSISLQMRNMTLLFLHLRLRQQLKASRMDSHQELTMFQQNF